MLINKTYKMEFGINFDGKGGWKLILCFDC